MIERRLRILRDGRQVAIDISSADWDRIGQATVAARPAASMELQEQIINMETLFVLTDWTTIAELRGETAVVK